MPIIRILNSHPKFSHEKKFQLTLSVECNKGNRGKGKRQKSGLKIVSVIKNPTKFVHDLFRKNKTIKLMVQ